VIALPALVASLLVVQTPPAAGGSPLPDLPEWVFAADPEDENLDVLHLGDSKPTLIRFRVRVNGQGFRSAWDTALARLYNYVDANDDGFLTEAEIARPGWRQLVAEPGMMASGGLAAPYPEAGVGPAYGSKGGRVSVEEFRRYVRDTLGHPPLQAQVAHAADPIDQAAFNQLDVDRDGMLSAVELATDRATADAILRRLDVDEDEVVDRGELEPNRNPFAGIFFDEGGPINGDPVGGPLVALSTPEARARAARRLLSRYDGTDSTTRDGTLSPRESGLGPEGFRLADSNGDGRLELAEVERRLASPAPEIVLVVRLAKGPGEAATIGEPTEAEGPATVDPRVAARPDGDRVIGLDGRQVRVTPNDATQDPGGFYVMQFDASDLDKDGSLDRSEATKGFYFRRFFDAADRNGDEKLTKAEVTLYFDRFADLARCRASIHLSEDGRPVFEALDADGDGRLGRRELREAGKRLKALDRDGDGRLRLDEIPTTTRVRVGRGPANSNRGNVNIDTYDTQPTPRPPSGKPEVAWFRKMDRNRDGDVSPAEFLGTLEDFRKLDADHDGLIDEEEAAKGP
jgi:Ca2+-binding EF-hand superfamily protein